MMLLVLVLVLVLVLLAWPMIMCMWVVGFGLGLGGREAGGYRCWSRQIHMSAVFSLCSTPSIRTKGTCRQPVREAAGQSFDSA